MANERGVRNPSQMLKRPVKSLLWDLSRAIKEQFPKLHFCSKFLRLAKEDLQKSKYCGFKNEETFETKRTLLTATYDMLSLNFRFPFFKPSSEGIWWAGYHTWITWVILLLYLTEMHKVQTSCKFVHLSYMVWFCIPVPFLLKEWLTVVVIAWCFPSWPRTCIEHWRAESAATSGRRY